VENVTQTLTVSGTALSPIIIAASDSVRPTQKATKFVVTASHYIFSNIIFDASEMHESNFDLWRPSESLAFSGCDLEGASEFAELNEINLINSQDDPSGEASNIRIWGASGITLDSYDFYPSTSESQYGCVYVINASGNTITADATGYDTSILSDITLNNCNDFGAAAHLLVMRRPVENVTVTNCEAMHHATNNGYFLYARQSNRVGSPIAQQFSGQPGATCRNYTVTNCSATMYYGIVIDDATDGTNGPAGNFDFENLTLTLTGDLAILCDDDTSAGGVPTTSDNSVNWMGHYENVTIRNIVVNSAGNGILMGGGAGNDAGEFYNVLIDNASMDCHWSFVYFGDSFGGNNITIQNCNAVSHAYYGVRMLLHDGFANRYSNVVYDNDNFAADSTVIRAEDGAANHYNGYNDFAITNCDLECTGNNVAYYAGDAVINRATYTNSTFHSGSQNNTFWILNGGYAAGSNSILIDNNTIFNDSDLALWGLRIANSVAGFLTITNNAITSQETGIMVAGNGNQNVLIDNNTITVGQTPTGEVSARGTYQAIQFYGTDGDNITVTNNTFTTMRPNHTYAGDRGDAVGIEYLANTDVFSNFTITDNTLYGLWPRFLQMSGSSGCSIENGTVENNTNPDGKMWLGLFYLSNGATARNVSIGNNTSPGSSFEGDSIAIYGGGADGLTIHDMVADCGNQAVVHSTAPDWGGCWASTGIAANNVTFRNMTFLNINGPAIYANGPLTNWTIQDCVVQNSGNLVGTLSAIHMNGNASNFAVLNDLILDSRGGVRLTGYFNVVSGNIIALKGDSTLDGIDVMDGGGDLIKRNGIAGPGVAPAGVADGTGIVLNGSFATLTGSTVYNNTFAGFANGMVISGSGNTVYNNAFPETTGTGVSMAAGTAGNTVAFNAYDAGTTYGGAAAAGTGDVVAGDLGISTYDPTTVAFMLPVTSPPSPLIDAGSGDGTAPDGTTDIGYREAGAAGGCSLDARDNLR